MGAGNSTELRITFDRPNLFYYAGEPVSGTVIFQNTQDKVTIDKVLVEFTGELGYTTQESRQVLENNGGSRSESYTEHHTVTFINIHIPVAQPQYGQQEIILYRGEHSWPFTFVLPPLLPPSLFPATTSYPCVRYNARVILDKPWYKANVKQVYPLIIFPRINLMYTPGGHQPIPFQNQNRKKLRLQGYLLRGGVIPGDNISIQVDLQNPKNIIIKRIEATLVQHRQVGPTCHTETISRFDLPELREFSGATLERTFELMVPAIMLSPSFTYLTPGRLSPIATSVRYELTLEVKARGLFTDFKITIPVLVGTEPSAFEQHPSSPGQINVPFEIPSPSAPVMDFHELPPSYDSVVTDQKPY